MVLSRQLAVLLLFPACLSLAPHSRAGEAAWVEVRSAHFVVVSNAGEKQARRVAVEFEQFRAVFQRVRPHWRVDPDKPVIILAVQDQATFKALLPGFFEREGQARPSGVFTPGQEKHYAAIQMGLPGPSPYHTVYHEYGHLLNRLNLPRLPVWLNEGLAELYASTDPGTRAATLGRPIESHVHLLKRSKLLPLSVLLTVDRSSAHYNEADKASLFYAQSWALVHLLMIGEAPAGPGKLEVFLQHLNVSELEAARQAFGDLAQLENRLQGYIRQSRFEALSVPAPPEAPEEPFPARELSAAEVAALQGDFLLHTHRPAEARARLEEALRLDPGLPAAYESLGLLHMRADQPDAAFPLLEKALALGSKSYLAHYYFAVLKAEKSSDPVELEIAEEHLERAIELNPQFAPAYAALSGFYASRAIDLEAGLGFARKAVELDPQARDFQFNVGRILLRMQRLDEAIALGERLLAESAGDAARHEAQTFLKAARQHQENLARWKREEEAARAAAEERRRRALESAAASAPPAEPALPRWGQGASRRRVTGSGVEGWIRSVTCRGRTMDLQLDFGPYSLRLHSRNYFELSFSSAGWQPPANFDPCKHIKGQRALVIYTAVEGTPYAGEILSVELRR